MANKRELKKRINYICSDLFAECIAASLYGIPADKQTLDALLYSIIKIHSNYIARISHPEPGMKAGAYYKDLTENFSKQINEIVDQIGNLN